MTMDHTLEYEDLPVPPLVRAEEEAEQLYRHVVKTIEEMDPEAAKWFRLKFGWYSIWRMPYAQRERVENAAAMNGVGPKGKGRGMFTAHVHRPPWIRMYEPDEYDRGESPERTGVPI